MAKPNTLDLLHDHMFGESSVQLTEKQKEQLQRYQSVFTVWLENPWMSNKALREFLVNTYGISVTQAYQDIKNVQILLGNVKRATKEWYRYIANEMVKQAICDLDNSKEDVKSAFFRAKAKIAAAEALVKINRLNKIDADPFDWDQIKLPDFEPTNDPVEAGILTGTSRSELEEKIRKLEEKYSEVIEIKDVPYESVNGN